MVLRLHIKGDCALGHHITFGQGLLIVRGLHGWDWNDVAERGGVRLFVVLRERK